ncbi:MAG TPA: amino acid ABC transporter substrate-binding protein [Candidatus Blautia excrementipullorum]|nr:amino acid ABC transporter substrate-binding protein [Candidatus Blautia excrementipullorum]
MKKKTVAVMMAALMAMGMMSAVSVQAGIEDKTLIVGFDAEYPPYGYMDENGEYTGFDLELAQAVCDLEGWELEKKPISWDSKDQELDAGSIDCIWNGFTMNGREDDYTFSVPYVDNSQVIVVAEDSGIDTLADLAGKTVGVQAASAALELLQSEEEGGQKELADTFGSLNEFADYNTAFTELQAGALDALAIDVGVANYQLKSRGEGFKMLDETLNTEQYAIGFKKGNQELCDIVNEDLQKLTDDGTVAELAEKYDIADMVTLTASDDASEETTENAEADESAASDDTEAAEESDDAAADDASAEDSAAEEAE